MWSVCTKEVILSLIDDVELISREILDNCVQPKPKVDSCLFLLLQFATVPSESFKVAAATFNPFF